MAFGLKSTSHQFKLHHFASFVIHPRTVSGTAVSFYISTTLPDTLTHNVSPLQPIYSYISRHPPSICASSWIPTRDPIMRIMEQLATSSCRYVVRISHLSSEMLTPTIALTFVMAPLPNSICSRCSQAGDYSETNSAYVDFGRFLTGMLVVRPPPCVLLLRYGQ